MTRSPRVTCEGGAAVLGNLLAVAGANGPGSLHDWSAWLVYIAGAILILAGAFGVILLRNAVHCALMLVMTLFGVAVEFIDQSADFLAAMQIIVYAGAIVILFLFVIMLLGVDRPERIRRDPFKGQKPLAIALGLMVFVELLVLSQVHHWAGGAHAQTAPLPANRANNVSVLGQSIFTRYLLPFEVTSALLVIAVVAAVVLARRSERTASELTKAEQEEVQVR